jgi:hypothetical protein
MYLLGKLVAVLLGISDEDEIERLLLAYTPKFHQHDEFWRQLDAEYNSIIDA